MLSLTNIIIVKVIFCPDINFALFFQIPFVEHSVQWGSQTTPCKWKWRVLVSMNHVYIYILKMY